MSLAINTDKIVSVLLADGWHQVKSTTFYLDAYEYGYDVEKTGPRGNKYTDWFCEHGGGASGICSKGFQFTDDHGNKISGPLTAILAVKEQGSV